MVKGRRNIYIATDGSYREGYNIGGWAYWIDIDGKRTKRSGSMEFVYSSIEAELMAIQKAVEHTALLCPIGKANVILIHMDTIQAIEEINHPTHPLGQQVHDALRALSLRMGVVPLIRHVKAHTPQKGHKFEKNRWCDKAAGDKMRILLTKKKKDAKI